MYQKNIFNISSKYLHNNYTKLNSFCYFNIMLIIPIYRESRIIYQQFFYSQFLKYKLAKIWNLRVIIKLPNKFTEIAAWRKENPLFSPVDDLVVIEIFGSVDQPI